MPEFLKAWVTVVLMAGLVFAIARKALVAGHFVSNGDYWRRAGTWLLVTSAAFLAHNFWLFVVIAMPAIYAAAAREKSALACYCLLIFAVPPFGAQLSGLGVFNYLFELTYIRMLNLVILLPSALRLFSASNHRPKGPVLPDVLLAAYLLLTLVLSAMLLPFTSAMRQGFYLFVDVWLVYYVVSRSLASMDEARQAAAALVLSCVIMAVIALSEAVRGWLLYATLASNLQLHFSFGNYMGRGEGSHIRALASAGHSIALGSFLMVAIALLVFMKSAALSRKMYLLTMAVLLAGLLVTQSRGPWIGALVCALVMTLIGRGAFRRFLSFIFAGAALVGLAALTGVGQQYIDMLPFIGTAASGSVEYRQRLFDITMRVLAQSPFFGEPRFFSLAAVQDLRQGEGIIDMVNTYLGVAVAAGGVGLALFAGFFVSAVFLAWREGLKSSHVPQGSELARSVVAASLGMLIVIATTSSVLAIPTVHFLLGGLCMACVRLLRDTPAVPTPAPAPAEASWPPAEPARYRPVAVPRSR